MAQLKSAETQIKSARANLVNARSTFDRAEKLYENKLLQLREVMSVQEKRLNDANRETGSNNWITTLPVKEFSYNLNKEEFWDALRIRYGWNLPRLPSDCAWGNKFDLSHAFSCKKG